MIYQAYVLDIAVRNLDAVARTFTQILGVPPIPMHPDMDPSGNLIGTHFTTQGLYSLGLLGLKEPEREFDPKKEPKDAGAWALKHRLSTRGGGASLLGFLVDDIDKHVAEQRKRGVRFMTDEPRRYMVGRNIAVDPTTTFGAEILYAQHDPDAYARWIATDPSRAPKDVQTSPRKVYAITVAVRDLAAAVPVFREVLQSDPVPMHPEMDASGNVVGVHFAIGGLQSFGVVALRDPTRRYAPPNVDPTEAGAWLLQRHLESAGEGYFHLGLLVEDLDADVAALEGQGVRFVLDEPLSYAVGRTNFVDPTTTHGVTVSLAQHDTEAYLRWRQRWAIW